MKKHPYGSYYLTESDREYKQRARRRERHKVRQLLYIDPMHESLPHRKEFGDARESGKGRKVFVPALQMIGWDMTLKEMLRWLRK